MLRRVGEGHRRIQDMDQHDYYDLLSYGPKYAHSYGYGLNQRKRRNAYMARAHVWYTHVYYYCIAAPVEVHMRKVRSLQLSAGCRVEAEAGRAKWVL